MSNDWTVQIDQAPPEGSWSPWLAAMNLRGSIFVAGSVTDFLKACRSAESTAMVQRETTNPHDQNALAVFGVMGASSWRLGYIPKATAARLAKFSGDMPISARVMHVRFVGSRIFVNVQLFLPPPDIREGYKR